MIDKVSLVFLTKLQHLSLGFVLNFEELQVDGRITVMITAVCLSIGYTTYIYIFGIPVYLVYLSTTFVWSQDYFMMRQHECDELQTPNFKNHSIRI